jgi:hypothetical protein
MKLWYFPAHDLSPPSLNFRGLVAVGNVRRACCSALTANATTELGGSPSPARQRDKATRHRDGWGERFYIDEHPLAFLRARFLNLAINEM